MTPLQYHLSLFFKVGRKIKKYLQDRTGAELRGPRTTRPSLLHISLSLWHISL